MIVTGAVLIGWIDGGIAETSQNFSSCIRVVCVVSVAELLVVVGFSLIVVVSVGVLSLGTAGLVLMSGFACSVIVSCIKYTDIVCFYFQM